MLGCGDDGAFYIGGYICGAVMYSDDQYCLSFLENLAFIVENSDAAREGYIVVEKISYVARKTPYIAEHYIVIRFRDYSVSVSCLDHRRVEVKIHVKNADNRYIIHTKQEIEQFQKDLLTLINLVRYSMKIREIIAKK
jgi:hypothetical protein